MLYVEQYVYSNGLRNSHPLERLAFSILTMMIGLAQDSWAVHILVFCLMISLLVFKARLPILVVAKLLLVPLGFLTVGVITIALTVQTNNSGLLVSVAWHKYFLGITAYSLTMALTALFSSVSAVSCLYFLVLTTPVTELIYALEFLKVPWVIRELMMLVYRFIFIFLETALQIHNAQASRGGYITLSRSVRSFSLLVANLWSRAYFKGQTLYRALLSRGYDSRLLVLNPPYVFSFRNIAFIIVIDLSLVLVAAL